MAIIQKVRFSSRNLNELLGFLMGYLGMELEIGEVTNDVLYLKHKTEHGWNFMNELNGGTIEKRQTPSCGAEYYRWEKDEVINNEEL